MIGLRSLVGAAAGIGYLNLVLTLQNVWPTPWVRAVPEISIEIIIIVLATVLFTEFKGLPGKALRRTALAVLLLLVIGRYADITAPALFGRRIELYWDARYVPAVAAMIAEAAPLWQVLAAVAGLLAGSAALIFVLHVAIRGVLSGMRHTGIRRGIGTVAGGFALLYVANSAGLHTGTERWFALPVTPVYTAQAEFLFKANEAHAAPKSSLPQSNLARAKGGDVYVMFIESYGSVIFSRPEMHDALKADYAALDAQMARSGWNAVSAFVDSPTFGGGSWLAHSTLLSGEWITTQPDYKMFLATKPETLVERFRAAGYRTVALYPGIKRAWPEGKALGFDRLMTAPDIAYHGPAFGWWKLPDQATLETFYESEIARDHRKPLFLTFASLATHMPFGPTPPYLTDWSRITAPTPFDPAAADAALALKPDWRNFTPAYERAVKYSLKMLGGFLEHRVPKNALLVVLGDHQPPALVSGKGASWSVPVHILSQDKALLERFTAAGFRSGLSPKPPASMRMDALNHLLLRALDSSPRLAGALRH